MEAAQAVAFVLQRLPAAAVEDPGRGGVVRDAGVAEAADGVGVEGVDAGRDHREGRVLRGRVSAR